MTFDDADEAARRLFKRNEEFLDWVWSRGIFAKFILAIYILATVAPSLFNGFAIFYLWFTFYPIAVTLTERLEVLGIIIALVNAEILIVRWFLLQIMVYTYVTQRRRRRKIDSQTSLTA